VIEEGSDGEAAICCVEEREDEVEGEGGEEGEEEGVGWEEEVDEGVEGEEKWGGEPGRRGAEEEGEEGGTADCTGQGGKGNNDGKEEGGRGKREMVSSDRPTKLLPPLLSFHAQSRYKKYSQAITRYPTRFFNNPSSFAPLDLLEERICSQAIATLIACRGRRRGIVGRRGWMGWESTRRLVERDSRVG